MLAIFHKAFAHPLEELNSPASKKCLLPQQTLQKFISTRPFDTSYFTFGDAAALAFVRPNCTSLLNHTQRTHNESLVHQTFQIKMFDGSDFYESTPKYTSNIQQENSDMWKNVLQSSPFGNYSICTDDNLQQQQQPCDFTITDPGFGDDVFNFSSKLLE